MRTNVVSVAPLNQFQAGGIRTLVPALATLVELHHPNRLGLPRELHPVTSTSRLNWLGEF